MSNNYHNTNSLVGRHLADAKSKCRSQQEIILNVFEFRRSRNLTPWEVYDLIKDELHEPPITSIRRAISNLTKDEHLVKTDVMRATGKYGKPEYAWKFNPAVTIVRQATLFDMAPESAAKNGTFNSENW